MFLQTVGLLPDNIIILNSSRKTSEDRIRDKLRQINPKIDKSSLEIYPKNSVDECLLNLSSVKEIYKGFYSEIDTSGKSKSTIIEDIAVRFFFNFF
jgi:hypothetical protein